MFVRPIVATIPVTRKEHAALLESRLQAQRDCLERLGCDRPDAPVSYGAVRTLLRVHERCPDGSLRASVVIEVSGQRHRYVRSLRVVSGESRKAERPVELRLS